MKKISLLFLFGILGVNVSYSQTDSIFQFNQKLNNLIIGYDFENLRKVKKVDEFGPFHIKYERAFSKNIGIGGVSYFHHEKSYHEKESIVFSNGEVRRSNEIIWGFSIIPKVNWHFSTSHFKNKNIKKFDVYLGAGIGYGFEGQEYDYLMKDESPNNELIYGSSNVDETIKKHFVATEVNLGVRYYALNNFGAYFELGFGVSRAQLGLIYKW